MLYNAYIHRNFSYLAGLSSTTYFIFFIFNSPRLNLLKVKKKKYERWIQSKNEIKNDNAVAIQKVSTGTFMKG